MQIKTEIEFDTEYQHRLHPELKGICGAYISYRTQCNQVRLDSVRKGEIHSVWVDESDIIASVADPGGPAPSSLPVAGHP